MRIVHGKAHRTAIGAIIAINQRPSLWRKEWAFWLHAARLFLDAWGGNRASGQPVLGVPQILTLMAD